MRQAGRYLDEYRAVRSQASDFLNFCYTPDLAVEVTLQPIRRFGFDAAIMFSDILVVPDALGQPVRFEEGKGPILEPLADEAAIDALDPDRMPGHLAPVFEILGRLREELPAETTLIGFAGAPWTLAFYMIEGRGGVDGGRLKRMAFGRPDMFGRLMTVLETTLIEYLSRQVEAGAEVLQLFDSWAGIADESLFRRWVIGPTKRIVAGVKARHPDIPVIGFPRGGGPMIVDYVAETGVDGVSLDSQVPLDWAQDFLKEKVVIQGNLDNQLLVVGGEAMDRAIDRIVAAFAAGPFIFNLGHGIVPDTPPDNVARAIARARGET